MLKQEFESRVRMQVSIEEYAHIEQVYNNCDVDKDEFCKLWVKMNHSRVEKAISKALANNKREALKDKLWDIIATYAEKSYEWKERKLAVDILSKRKVAAVKEAGLSLELGGSFKTMATMLWDIRRYLKLN